MQPPCIPGEKTTAQHYLLLANESSLICCLLNPFLHSLSCSKGLHTSKSFFLSVLTCNPNISFSPSFRSPPLPCLSFPFSPPLPIWSRVAAISHTVYSVSLSPYGFDHLIIERQCPLFMSKVDINIFIENQSNSLTL